MMKFGNGILRERSRRRRCAMHASIHLGEVTEAAWGCWWGVVFSGLWYGWNAWAVSDIVPHKPRISD